MCRFFLKKTSTFNIKNWRGGGGLPWLPASSPRVGAVSSHGRWPGGGGRATTAPPSTRSSRRGGSGPRQTNGGGGGWAQVFAFDFFLLLFNGSMLSDMFLIWVIGNLICFWMNGEMCCWMNGEMC